MAGKLKEEQIFVCEHCHKHYTREHAFVKHTCKTLTRRLDFKSLEGQTAWEYYQAWRTRQGRTCGTADGFMHSATFTTFVKFVQHCKAVRLPKPIKFINIMILKKIPPHLWTNNVVYTDYISHVDDDGSPCDQAEESAVVLYDYADRYGVDISEVFDHIPPNELIQLIRVRKVSVWLLFHSGKFGDWYSNLGEGERAAIREIVDYDVWALKQQRYVTDIKCIEDLIERLGL